MSRSTRTRRAVIAMALAIWSEACAVHRSIPPDGSIRPGSDVRVSSMTPLQITRQTDSLPPVPACCTTTVEGRFVRAAGDTIFLDRGSRVAVMSNLTRVPGQPEILAVVRTPGTEVTVRQTDGGRTTALIIGIAAVLIGLAALAASQMDYGLPESGGGPSFLGPAAIGP
jgi:hypothetical protein